MTNYYQVYLSNYGSGFQSLEVLCESGVTLAKNFERLLSPGPGGNKTKKHTSVII